MLKEPLDTSEWESVVEGEYSVLIVPPELIASIWSSLEPLLLERSDLWEMAQDLETIRTLLEAGALGLWSVAKDGVQLIWVITLFKVYPAMRTLNVCWAMGEKLESYLPMLLEALELFAARNDCSMVVIEGRKGWERVLKPFGYKHLAHLIAKEVTHRSLN